MMGGCFCVHFGPSLVKVAKFSLQRQSRPLSCEGKDAESNSNNDFSCKSVFKVIRTFLAYCSEDRSPVRLRESLLEFLKLFGPIGSEDRF